VAKREADGVTGTLLGDPRVNEGTA